MLESFLPELALPENSQLLGQLESMITERRLPHAIIIEGADGELNGRLARLCARAFLCSCERPLEGECRVCRLMATYGAHADIVKVEGSGKTGAIPVITTATDLNHKFAVDVFAKKNGLHIVNKDGIATVSSKVLAGKTITLSVERGRVVEGSRIPEGIEIVSYPPKQVVDILITAEEKVNAGGLCLRPREYIVGMGCRRGKEPEKIADYIQQKLDMVGISKEQVYALASIDKKKDEEGLIAWCRNANVPFGIYTAEELEAVEGDFKASDFVKEQVGVDNVCERAALRACGKDGRLILHKQAEDGMTIAIARREWSVKFDEE